MQGNKSRQPGDVNLGETYTAFRLTAVLSLLVLSGSLAGIAFTDAVYPQGDPSGNFVPNDIVNLILLLPVLLLMMLLARRGRVLATLFWLGSILVIIYNSVAYVAGISFLPLRLLYLLLLALGAAIVWLLITGSRGDDWKLHLEWVFPARLTAVVLALLGLAFGGRALTMLLPLQRTAVSLAEDPVLAADAVFGLLWLVGGVQGWRRSAIGYVLAPALLFQATLLFAGVILVLLIQPILSGIPLDPAAPLVVLAMGLPCFALLALTLRRSGHPSDDSAPHASG